MTSDAYLAAEARARVEIDRQLAACGWAVQSRDQMNLYARQGVAVREFIMAPGHGQADYLLFIDGQAGRQTTNLASINLQHSGSLSRSGPPRSRCGSLLRSTPTSHSSMPAKRPWMQG